MTPPGAGVAATGVAGAGAEAGDSGRAWSRAGVGLGAAGLGVWLVALWHGLHAVYNVYYAADAGLGVPYDYSQPIDTVERTRSRKRWPTRRWRCLTPARGSFRDGNYADALQKVDQAFAKLPNDTTLHEFRALCLFALGRYDEAAATLYAVLSVGPGWDWTTLISLYPSVDVYTTQLRALEDYCKVQRQSASARFVLAYHYLTEGFNDAAVKMLKQVVALKPNDTLTAKLLRQLDAPKEPAATATAARTASVPDESDADAAAGCDDRRHLDCDAGGRHVDRALDQARRGI